MKWRKCQNISILGFYRNVMLYNTLTAIKIELKVSNSLGKAPKCFQRSGQIYFPDTSTYRRNVVCLASLRSSHRMTYIGLFVKSFMFHVPNKLTGVISSWCQYGGLSSRLLARCTNFVKILLIYTFTHNIRHCRLH